MAKDGYKTLGLTELKTSGKIKKAFKELTLKYHPDKNKEKEDEEKFQEVTEAYQSLTNAPSDKTGLSCVGGKLNRDLERYVEGCSVLTDKFARVCYLMLAFLIIAGCFFVILDSFANHNQPSCIRNHTEIDGKWYFGNGTRVLFGSEVNVCKEMVYDIKANRI